MTRHRNFPAAVWVAAVTLTLADAPGARCDTPADGPLAGRLRREMPKRLQALQDAVAADRLLIESDVTVRDLTANRVAVRQRLSARKDGARFVWTAADRQPRPNARVCAFACGINEDYSFRTERKTPNSPWLLAKFDLQLQGGAGGLTAEVQAYAAGVTNHLARVSSVRGALDVPKLFELPGFQLTGVTEGGTAGQVRADFAFTAESPDPLKQGTVEAWMVFDTQEAWLPVEWLQHLRSPGGEEDLHVVRTIARDGNRYECRTTARESYAPKGAAGRQVEREIHYTVTRKPDFSADDFRLASFGLPEPPGVRAVGGTNYSVWFLGAGAGCLVLFFGLRSRLSRREGEPGAGVSRP